MRRNSVSSHEHKPNRKIKICQLNSFHARRRPFSPCVWGERGAQAAAERPERAFPYVMRIVPFRQVNVDRAFRALRKSGEEIIQIGGQHIFDPFMQMYR